MKKWVYVICEEVDGDPSFRHTFVDAPTADEAYALGANALPPPEHGLNDYVIELPA